MKAAIIPAFGQSPLYRDIAEPVAKAGEVIVTVTAAALTPLARVRASGSHYSAASMVFPFVAGVDGVGRLADGRRVAFLLPEPPNGAFAERTVVPAARCLPVPDALDDATAAALSNPSTSWPALTERARLQPGETVLVNGATGMSGRLAIMIARHLGAGRVIATGRDAAALATVGADATLPLAAEDASLDEAFAGGVDIVLDYLWGESAQRLLAAAARARKGRVRFVQIGASSGGTISLDAALLRSSAIEIMGTGIGSLSLDQMIAGGTAVLAAAPGRFTLPIRAVPLADVERAWTQEDSRHRIVFTIS